MSRPTWIAFDLNGTLLDPAALLGPGREDLGRAVLDDAVMQAMADTLTGGHRPFTDYMRAALERRLACEGANGDALDEALQRATRLPSLPDAAAALATLVEAGYRIAVVTNSAADAASAALRSAQLDALVDFVVGADEVGAFKPDPRVYRHAAARLGVAPSAICLVAAHAWDVLGAMRAGWQAAWVGHREGRLLSTVPEPLVSAPSLTDAARALANL